MGIENSFDGPKSLPYPKIEDFNKTSAAATETEFTPEQEEGLIIAENFELQRADLMALEITEGPLTEKDSENIRFLKKMLAEFDDENF